jgi:nuclear transport factor 2 (NTF2) superfamily protein
MREGQAWINDLPIPEDVRLLNGPTGCRLDDHPRLSSFGF